MAIQAPKRMGRTDRRQPPAGLGGPRTTDPAAIPGDPQTGNGGFVKGVETWLPGQLRFVPVMIGAQQPRNLRIGNDAVMQKHGVGFQPNVFARRQ